MSPAPEGGRPFPKRPANNADWSLRATCHPEAVRRIVPARPLQPHRAPSARLGRPGGVPGPLPRGGDCLPAVLSRRPDRRPAGRGVFEKSIVALRKLNHLRYGSKGTGLTLNLVYNPVGAHRHLQPLLWLHRPSRLVLRRQHHPGLNNPSVCGSGIEGRRGCWIEGLRSILGYEK